MRTNVYIDGFNLYYGLLKGSSYKWLNLEAFCDALLPRNAVQRILYFTALVEARPHDPQQPVRQATYLRALRTLPRIEIHLGTFLSSVVRQPLVASDPVNGKALYHNSQPKLRTDAAGNVVTEWVLKTEEKGSDVNLAAHLMLDAFQKNCDCAVVVSNDSDLLTPIHMAKSNLGMVIGLIPPRRNGSAQLKALADFKIDPRTHVLASSQFPAALPDQSGIIHKPPAW